eukprot:3941188-Rhodomonas_salina.5
MRCPVLRSRTALRVCYAMSGTEIAHRQAVGCAATALKHPTTRGSPLRTCYAVSGTHIAYGGKRLRTWYAMSGTEIVYGATRIPMQSTRYHVILPSYAFATRCPVLTRDMPVPSYARCNFSY